MSGAEQTPGPAGEDDPGAPAEPALRFAVVISGDGSAAIDGEPVPSADGVTVDAAILDVLQGHARDHGTAVTATISDPAAGYVARIEVSPDGSSTLVDQSEHPPTEPVPSTPPEATDTADPPEDNDAELDDDVDIDDDGDDDVDIDDDGDDDGDDDFDMEAYTRERQHRRESTTPPPPPPPSGPAPDADEDRHPDPALEADAVPPTAGDRGPELTAWGDDSTPRPGATPRSDTTAHSEAPAARPRPQLVRRPGSRQSDDEYEGPGLLHRPLVVGPVALVAAALVVVPLVMLGTGGSDDGGRREEAARSSRETSPGPETGGPGPVSTVSPSASPSPDSSASPSGGSKKPKGAKGSKDAKGAKGTGDGKGPGGGGTVTVTVTARPPRATVTAKPAQDTAATAVNRLARNDPSGRHVCYRAYVSGQGWQKPVCDGTMAGTSGRNSPIKALNIAVSGSGGSAANAFVHNPDSTDGRGTWEPAWTAVIADGGNNYIGSTKKSAPVMSGFAINIGSGRVCQTAKVHGFDWGAQGCADARPGYVFGGALENDRWLEAVRFTV
ncbi:hypothetical protein [Streptomyces aureus]|uniref:hypothetical protein n=1 Tax=Streptomyces aureus TaxID=193461 RepID=UPI0036B58282